MALNRCVLMGRIVNDLEMRQTQSGVACLSFTVAVDRSFKNANGEYNTDFISCVAWRETCEFIAKWFSKGRMIALEGQLRSRTYEDKNGTKHYVTEVYVDTASFTGEKPSQNEQSATQNGFNYEGGNYTTQTTNRAQSGSPFISGTSQPPSTRQTTSPLLGDLSEFEDVLTDDGSVPF